MLKAVIPVDPSSRCFVCQPNDFTRKHVIKKLDKITIRKCPTGKLRLIVTPNQHVAFFRDLMSLKQNQSKLAAASAIFGSDFGPCIEELYNWFDEKTIKNFKISFGEGKYGSDRHAEIVVKLVPREFIKVLPAQDAKSYEKGCKRCRSCPNEYILSPTERKERVDAVKAMKAALGIVDKPKLVAVKEEVETKNVGKAADNKEITSSGASASHTNASPPMSATSAPAGSSVASDKILEQVEEDEGDPECQACRKKRGSMKLNQPLPPISVLEPSTRTSSVKTELGASFNGPLSGPVALSSSPSMFPPPPSFPPPVPSAQPIYNPYGTPLPKTSPSPGPPSTPPPSPWMTTVSNPGSYPSLSRSTGSIPMRPMGPGSQTPPPPPPLPGPSVNSQNRFSQYSFPDLSGNKRKDSPMLDDLSMRATRAMPPAGLPHSMMRPPSTNQLPSWPPR